MSKKWPQVALFKVLVKGCPCYGGDGKYPKLGVWTPPVKPRVCKSGYHLTADPLRWWRPDADLYLAEGRGRLDGRGDDKAAFQQVRLLRKVTPKWPLLTVFPRVRAFLAATERSRDAGADISWANLSGADLSGADRPTNPPSGWTCCQDGRLKRAET